MRITFLMPEYAWAPSGGFRVAYEYANRLTDRGHQVTVVHPRRLEYPPPPERLTVRRWVRRKANGLHELISKPSMDWQRIDKRVRLLFVPSSHARHIPDGDALFATAWHTVRSVVECPSAKGEKFYLIQGYETWQGPKELVDATWQSPLHKVVVSKWLLDLGKERGCNDLVCIPNAIDHERYRLTRPIDGRSRRVVMLFSPVQIKGCADGIEALRIARERFPELRVVFFGIARRQPWIPKWVQYYRNPPRDFIVDEIYNRSSIFLSSSWAEGFALPPAEAACCGCAVVATDSGGIRDFIQNGVTGLLSPPKDPVALAENLCLLLGNEDLRMKLARACQSVITHLSWDRSAALLESFITAALHHRRLKEGVFHHIRLGSEDNSQ